MAVRDMVHDLAHGPSTVPVGRIESLVREASYRGLETSRSLLYVVKEPGFLLFGE